MENLNKRYRHELKSLAPYVPGRPMADVKKEYGLETVVKLASNENPYGCSQRVKEAVMEALEAPSLYPDGNCTDLKEEIARKYHVKPNQILLGNGTDEIISMLGKTFIDKDDECITAEITFSQYEASVKSMGGKMVFVPMKNHGFDLDAIEGAVHEKTKMVFIANPNNPTGTIHTWEDQLDFMKKIPSDVLVVMDEAYQEFVADERYPNTLNMLKQYKNIILLKTFSKAYGLASFRVGFAIADKSIISVMERIRNPFNVSVPAQRAALAALLDEEFVNSAVLKNREVLAYFTGELDKMGFSHIKSHANFIMVDVKKSSTEAFQRLMALGYIVRPGSAFHMDTYLRVSIGTMEQMQGFTEALKEFI